VSFSLPPPTSLCPPANQHSTTEGTDLLEVNVSPSLSGCQSMISHLVLRSSRLTACLKTLIVAFELKGRWRGMMAPTLATVSLMDGQLLQSRLCEMTNQTPRKSIATALQNVALKERAGLAFYTSCMQKQPIYTSCMQKQPIYDSQ
jgi:hypothetical protein